MNAQVSANSLVVIVGAGASKEVGLPVGEELKVQISRALDIKYKDGFSQSSGSRTIAEAYKRLGSHGLQGPTAGDYQRAGWSIRDAMPQAASIDNFIDAHNENLLIAICGKLAIAECILEAERNSRIFINLSRGNEKINFEGTNSSWFSSFFRVLVEGCQFSDIQRRLGSLAFITFNYDRCIEHYLHQALMNYYQVNSGAARDALSTLRIFHPYGVIGELPWSNSQNAVDFGMSAGVDKLIEIAGRLKTFTEGTDQTHSEIVLIRDTLRSAERVVYLGFAFNDQNLDLLYGGERRSKNLGRNVVYGTALGISASDTALIKQTLVDRGYHDLDRVYLEREASCASLFHEYKRSLAVRS